MSDMLFTDAEACGCNRWNCRRCNPSDPFEGAMRAASDWVYKADRWFSTLPSGAQFSSEDVTAAVGFPAGEQASNRNNAVGAWVRKLATQERILRSHPIASRNRASNGATIWVWRKC